MGLIINFFGPKVRDNFILGGDACSQLFRPKGVYFTLDFTTVDYLYTAYRVNIFYAFYSTLSYEGETSLFLILWGSTNKKLILGSGSTNLFSKFQIFCLFLVI